MASDDCRKLWHQHFAKIREFIEDLYGINTEIKFNKIEKQKEVQPENGSGCVATMGSIDKPTKAQEDVNLNDVLNSSMVNKAMELFQPETQIRLKPKV